MAKRTHATGAASTDPSTEADWSPLDDHEHRGQIAGLRRLLGRAPRRVLDLGCGDGRAARPLMRAGHKVIGIDRDPRAVWACAGADLACIRGDFVRDDDVWEQAARHGPFDAVLCLGHTFLTVSRPDDALAVLARAHRVLRRATRGAGAVFVIDDYTSLWREVAEGNWQEGLSEGGDAGEVQQLVWGEADNVIAIRKGRAVRRSSWRLSKPDEPLRLWSRGELDLLARAAGWHYTPRPKDHLGVFTR